MTIRLMYVNIRSTKTGTQILDYVFDTGKAGTDNRPLRYHQSSDVEQRLIGDLPVLATEADGFTFKLANLTNPDGEISPSVAIKTRFTATVADENVALTEGKDGKRAFLSAKPGLGWGAMTDVVAFQSPFVTCAGALPRAAAPAAPAVPAALQL